MRYAKWMMIMGLLWLAGCASLPVATTETPGEQAAAVVTSDLLAGIPTPINAPAIGTFQGTPYRLHYNARGQVVYQSQGQEQVLSGESPAGAVLTHLVHYADAAGVYVFWRPKLPRAVPGVGRPGDKLILFRASDDGKTFGKTHRLNRGGGAFLPRVAGNGRGDLYVVWTDERNGGGMYDLYMNISHDAGRSWKAEDLRVDPGEPGSNPSIDPTVAAEGDAVWVAWNEAGRPSTLMVRGSSNRGETWREPVEISREEFAPTGLTLVKLPAARGGRLVLYWFNQWEFKGAYSEDEGRTWQPVAPLPGVTDAGELKVAQDPSGRVSLVAGVLPDEKKEDLFFAASEDGLRFGNPVRLDTSMPHKTTSTDPQIVVDGEGRVLVLWQDLRNFRYDVYFTFSTDGGKTWLPEDRRLNAEGVLHAYHPRAVADGKGGFLVQWVGYEDDRRERGKIYAQRIAPGEPWSGGGGKRPSEARLRERVGRFWGDRLKADWGGNYDLMDPFFKQTTTREYYIANQFKTIYHAFDIKQAQIAENSAHVAIRYTVEIPEMVLQSGQKVRVPKREEEITEEWIWIDGDWHRVFKDIMGGNFVPR